MPRRCLKWIIYQLAIGRISYCTDRERWCNVHCIVKVNKEIRSVGKGERCLKIAGFVGAPVAVYIT